MIKKLYISALLLLFSPLLSPALAYYNPGEPQGMVSDFAKILSPETEQQLESELRTFEEKTGNEIAVVTIPSLQGDTIENFAVQLFKQWGVGKKNADNGALLLVAKDDRKVRIEVGYGLEGALTDAESYWIIEKTIIPEFKNENYDQGIFTGVSQIENAIEGEEMTFLKEDESLKERSFFKIENFNAIIFLLIGVWGVIMWFLHTLAKSHSFWFGGITLGIIGIIIALFISSLLFGAIIVPLLFFFGSLVDYIVSRKTKYFKEIKSRRGGGWWFGGPRGGGGFGGGGFGGFGGGRSGGGGASGSW